MSRTKRAEDRLHERLRCVCRTRTLQGLLRNPHRAAVVGQELAAIGAFIEMPLQLSAPRSGQRPFEVVADHLFQVRTRSHRCLSADVISHPALRPRRVESVAKPQTYRLSTGSTNTLKAALALCSRTLTAPAVVARARAVSSVLNPSMSRSSKTIR